MDANKLFQGFCENILKPIIQEAVSEPCQPIRKPSPQSAENAIGVDKSKSL